MSSDSLTQTWHIAFNDSDGDYWLKRYLEPGYTHCVAYTESPGGQFWLVVDPMRSHTHIDMMPISTNPAEFIGHAIVLTVTVPIDLDRQRGGLCQFNCVEVLKSLLGIKAFWIFTPHQLYKELLSWDQERAQPNEQHGHNKSRLLNRGRKKNNALPVLKTRTLENWSAVVEGYQVERC